MTRRTVPADRRPPDFRRTWLFLPGADEPVLQAAVETGADVLIQEFEDFTVPARRPEARALCRDLFAHWRRRGVLVAARVNPLETPDGPADLEAVMEAGPDIVLLPKCDDPARILRLDREISRLEARFSTPQGFTEIVPNIESARGLVRAGAIAAASPRVTAMLVASEDMAADLGAERSREGGELLHVRTRFLVECTAAGIVAIDCPYTYGDEDGLRRETLEARRLGYRAKSLVHPAHARCVNDVLTPERDAVEKAMRLVQAFDAARERGEERAELDGHAVEVPTYNAARRLLARAEAFDRLAAARGD